jgi:transcription antitermination factor NusG
MSMGISVQGWPWFAIQVRTGTEKNSTAILESKGYECFLPVSKLRRRWSDRIKQLDVPLFPGYLFCRFDPNHRLPVLMVPGVIQVVGIGKTPIPVDDDEIGALQCVGSNGVPALPWPYVNVGKMAQIECGPLRGLTGIVIQIKSEIKLVLSVCLLQRSVAVEVDPAWLGEPHPSNHAALAIDPGLPTGLDQNHFVPRHRDFSGGRSAAD